MAQKTQSTVVAPKLFVRKGVMYYTVANGESEPTNTGQLLVAYGDEKPTMQQAVGVGPVDVWFKCLQAHVAARGLFSRGLRFNGNGGDHFVIHSRGNGSEALALARVRLYYGECHADGEGTNENILIACADALLSAANGLLLDKSSGALPPEPVPAGAI